MLFTYQSVYSRCPQPLEKALERVGRFRDYVEGSQPKVNAQHIALSQPRTEDNGSGVPVTTIFGSYGSFLLRLRLQQVREDGQVFTEVELSMRLAPFYFVFMGILSAIMPLIGIFSGDPVPKMLSIGVSMFAIVALPVLLICSIALPAALERLEMHLDRAFLARE